MKIPFIPIHYKPDYIVSHVDKHFGDSISISLNTDETMNWHEGGVTGKFRNLSPLFGDFFKETGKQFRGIILGENIVTTEGRY